MKRITLLLMLTAMFWGCEDSELLNDRNVYFDLTELTLNKASFNDMITGESRKLLLAYGPAEATEKEVEWLTSDPTVATVDENGMVTATGLGEAVITVRSIAVKGIQTECEVFVTQNSGISVTDVLLETTVDGMLTFIRGDDPRDYTYFIQVYNSLDKRVGIASSNEATLAIDVWDDEERPGFTVTPGDLGSGYISIQSLANQDIVKNIPFQVITVDVTGVKLSMNADGSQEGENIAGEVTISRTHNLRVVFDTNNDEVKIPENKNLTCVSSDESVATVTNGYVDPATNIVYVPVTMVDNPANVTGAPASAVITVTTEQGGYQATFTVTAKMPKVEGLKINQSVTRPVVAGDTVILIATTIPEDAYVQDITWVSADESIATVDGGVVTIVPDFSYDPANYQSTEIMITAVSDDPQATAQVQAKIRPYQFVPAEGVMVTDQWGNRIVGHSKSVTDNKNPQDAGMQYCSGIGKNKTDYLNTIGSWGASHEDHPDTPQVGSIPVYLTATPIPYEYPRITDPNQEFLWINSTNTRFTMVSPTFPDGGSSLGLDTYNNDDGKTTRFTKGRTTLWFTGHGQTAADNICNARIFRIDGDDDGSTAISRKMLFKFAVCINDGKTNNANSPTMKVSEGVGHIYMDRTPATKFDDPAPWPWVGPDPVPTQGLPLTDAALKKIREKKSPY